jgi:hypothetical protein
MPLPLCLSADAFHYYATLTHFILIPSGIENRFHQVGCVIAFQRGHETIMGKSQKFFRYLWRINALLILLAAGAVTLGVGGLLIQEFGFKAARNREAGEGIAVAGPDSKLDLVLGQATIVEGTQVMRAELQRFAAGANFSSGSNSETRNILFIEPGQKAAHWLLPDNEHIVADSSDIRDETESKEKKVVVTAVLVKSTAESPESAFGKLLIFDPPGKMIVEVADHVRTIQVASIKGGELSLLYERDRRLFLNVFDLHSLAKLREQEIDVPQLK